MRTSLFLHVSTVLALGFSAQVAQALDVVATLPDLAAVAAEVGGDLVDVTVLASHVEEPHYVDPRPSHLVALSRADVLIANGLELEIGWLPPLQVQSRNRAVQIGGNGLVEAAAFVSPLDSDRIVDRSMGDVHPGGNPHFNFDPRAMAAVATGLGERFAELDRANADTYRRNAAALVAELQALATREAERFAALDSSLLQGVAYHDSLPYLFDWLGIEKVTTLEPLPGVAPDPRHVAEVVQTMRGESVRLLVQESYYPQNTSSRVTELSDAALVVIDGGTDFEGGETYAAHIQGVADVIYAALQ